MASIGESIKLKRPKKKTVKKPEPEPVAEPEPEPEPVSESEPEPESESESESDEETETRPCFRRCKGAEKPLKEFISKNGKMRKMCNSCSILECAASKKSKMKKKELRDENSDIDVE